ncbi:APC family permease [Nocardioides sp. B-3]|nr:APC family permease [Nocardioides sp. B-3]UUZ58929.1 APC family permease [Nocardioides sp. B-3]
MSVGDVSKRILLGRKLRSSQLGETLLPKRIALPVFASDALSSVAYAPDEIFIMLSVAGVSAYTRSWKIGLVVAPVMLTVVASYRQTVHAYPSGGGDYEVATVNLGRNAGITVASALLVDYVLTVAVSISSASQYAAGAIPFLIGHEAMVATAAVIVLASLNLRGVRESGAFFAVPTYLFMVAILGMCAYGLVQLLLGDLPKAESAHLQIDPAEGWDGPAHTGRDGVPAGASLLVGVCGPDGGRGHLQRRPRLQAAQEQERRHDAAPARVDRRDDDDERHRAGQADEHPVRRPARARTAAHRRRGSPARQLRAAPGDLADRARRVPGLLARLLLRRDGDRHHPGARRQHGLQRLPGARVDPGPRRARAAPRSGRAVTGWPTATASSSRRPCRSS